MNQKKPMTNRALPAIILLLLLACVTAGVLAFPKIREALFAPTEAAGAVATMQKTSKTYQYNNIDIFKFTIEYPEITSTDYPDAAALICAEIESQVAAYAENAEELYQEAIEAYDESQQEDYPFHPWEAYIMYQLTHNADGLLSLYIDQYLYFGGAHGSTLRSSATWELTQGTQRTLDSFGKPGTDYQSFILETIVQQARYNAAHDPDVMYFDDYPDLIKENFDPQSFYLTPDGLVIYYQQYEIGPYVMGLIEFTIPTDALALPN